jgi:outer membrane protein assembly factor BamB
MMRKKVIPYVALILGFLLFNLILPFASADWTMFHSDPSHSGAATGNPVLTPTFLWKYTTSNSVGSSPAVVNGVVYIGAGQSFIVKSGTFPYLSAVNKGAVYALNATNGQELWEHASIGQVDSSPAVVGNVVYFGSFDNNMYALNATNGATLWVYPTGDWVGSSPAVSDGVIYFGSNDHNIYALGIPSPFTYNCSFAYTITLTQIFQ